MSPQLVLLGGGHAHLFVLEGVAHKEFEGTHVTLVSTGRLQAYSGMVPGLVEGRYREEQLSFDLEASARRAGARFVAAGARRIHAGENQVELDDGRRLPFDVLSVATGSTVRGGDVPGVADRALLVKPIDQALRIAPAIADAVAAVGKPAAVVVGGGAGGIELALATRARLRGLAPRRAGSVTLVEQASRLFGGRLPRLERLALRALAVNGVVFRPETEVVAVEADGVRFADGSGLPGHVVVWAGGPASTPLLRSSGLALDPDGFLLVDRYLRSPSHGRIFAAGDAASLSQWPHTPKAGVSAVREGPVLRANLASVCRGREPSRIYRPRRRFLSLLNTGDGRGVLSYGSWATSGRWVMALKDRIDRRFMRRFQRLAGGAS